tara:strand:+ start:173 stop:364 length:192 start_codon:yes stop_codon:yes gene_type:complete
MKPHIRLKRVWVANLCGGFVAMAPSGFICSQPGIPVIGRGITPEQAYRSWAAFAKPDRIDSKR